MVLAPERILLIGDTQRQLHGAVSQAAPGAQVTAVGNYFDGIAELSAGKYSAVLAAAEPIERRPEAAVRRIRELAGEARVVLFGHPTLEPLSRKMLEFGCDDYVVTPVDPTDLGKLLAQPVRVAVPVPATSGGSVDEAATDTAEPALLRDLPLADVLLDALTEAPQAAMRAAIKRVNDLIAPVMRVVHLPADAAAPPPQEGLMVVSREVQSPYDGAGALHLMLPRDEDAAAARHFLYRLSELVAKLHVLQERHNNLQKLAITDDLTGLYNGRYFRHFLARILERAREKLFPVTLFIFDIDNFKKYNDAYGHGVGDEILKQTAALIRRCCREHDLVARLGGDEFAVVFWEKEGPRQPKDASTAATSAGKPPQTPEQVLERFKRLLASEEFPCLGPTGRGALTISGGVAVYPYHATSMEDLIALADRRLMFGAKQAGKNSIFLVGGNDQGPSAR